MTRVSIGVLGLSSAALAVVAAFACGASDSSSAALPLSSCLTSGLNQGGHPQCSACVAKSCGPQGGDFQSGCAQYLSCVCPTGGGVDTTAQLKCASDLSEAGCAKTIEPLDECERLSCAAPCGVVTTDAGAALAEAGSGGETTFSCSSGAGATMECDEQPLPASEMDAAIQGCAQVGGTAGGGCVDAGVTGCCHLPSTENCYYDDASTAQRQSTCATAGGMWSAGP